MSTNNSERLQKIRERKSQLEKLEKEIINREKAVQRKTDTRRKIIIGGIVLKYLPEFQKLEPKRTDKENEVVFAPVADFFFKLTRDKKLLEWLKETDK